MYGTMYVDKYEAVILNHYMLSELVCKTACIWFTIRTHYGFAEGSPDLYIYMYIYMYELRKYIIWPQMSGPDNSNGQSIWYQSQG